MSDFDRFRQVIEEMDYRRGLGEHLDGDFDRRFPDPSAENIAGYAVGVGIGVTMDLLEYYHEWIAQR
jgi:hypothetical protein